MNGVGTEEFATRLFDQFVNAVTCKSVFNTFHELCTVLGLQHVDHHNFYKCLKSRLTSWRAKSIWDKFDKRAAHRDYRGGAACADTRVLIIGAGPCGLRMAIEAAFLGAKTVVVEKRDRFSRNNVLHLWPFLITDLKNLGAKKFFGKFAAGAIDHISIRQLQCILLKVALLLGVEVHVNVGFINLVEPPEDQTDHMGWRCKVDPENHPVSEYQFDVLVGADGKRNTLSGFTRKEFRGKLAIAITANFINKNTTAEASVEEISGVAFIFNQKFFLDLKDKTGIDLENIVYYKDETHYFVMTAKKQSLFAKGVLKEDYADTIQLLSRENVNQDALMGYAKEAADVSTNYQLPHLEFAVNHYGQADLAMFDFTSMFAAENSSRVEEKNGHKLLKGIVGDSLLEPFWPTGSGCARGFLGAFDTAWMIKNWAAGKMRPLEILAERESIFQLLSQTTPESLHKLHSHYSIDPNTRYPNLNTIRILKPSQVRHLYDGGDAKLLDEEIPSKRRKQDGLVDPYSLLRWCQKILNNNIYRHVHIIDFTTSWKSGLALCALIHAFKPDLINFNQLLESNPMHNNQLALTIAEKELGITPVMSADDIANSDIPDRLNMMAYLSQFYRVFRTEPLPLVPIVHTRSLSKDEKNTRSPKHRTSFLQKLSSKLNKSKRKKEEEDKNFHKITHEEKLEEHQNIELTKYKKLPMDEIANKLTVTNKASTSYTPFSQKSKEEAQGAVSVNAMAEILAAKFRGDIPAQPVVKRLKGTPTLAAAQPNSEFCKFCAKRVYIMERMSAEGVFFHRGCLKCDFCDVNLRLNNYTVEREPDVKFFCFRHAIREQRLAAKRKRLMEDDIKENIPNDIVKKLGDRTPGESRSRSALKTPDNVLSPLRVNNLDLLDNASKTPERVEFENTFDGLEEESEEEQFEHNLRASLSSDTLLDDEDDDSSNSDSEGSLSDTEMAKILDEWSGAEDEDVLLDVTEGLGNQSITWEEACQLAKSWSTRHSTENLLKGATKDLVEEETPYTKLEEDNDDDMDDESDEDGDDEDTEVEDSEYESEEETETEGEDAESEVIVNKSAISSSPVKSPISPSVLAARASFFSSPPEVVRIDAFSMFKSKETKKAEEESQALAFEEAQKAAQVKEVQVEEAIDEDASSDKEEDSNCLPSESISEEISTDKSKITVMSLGDMELEGTDGELEQDSEEGEDSLAEESQEEDDDDNLLGKTAVSKEMERILAEIDDKDTSSENDRISLNSMTEPPCEDVEFHKQLVKDAAMKDEVFEDESSVTSNNIAKSALDKVQLDTVTTSEDTLQQVLNSVKAMETSSDEEGGKLMDKSLKKLDERFVTDRRRKGKNVKRSDSASSGSSFTISTPSDSPKSSTSSLADVAEYNKEFLDDGKDVKPDEDMLLDYTNTMSMVLDDESNDDDLPEDESKDLKEGDQTIKDEDANADDTLKSNESSYYMTPDASVVEVKDEHFKTPLEEDTNISSEDQKKAPIFNLHEEVSNQEVPKEEMVTETIKEVPSFVITSPKSPTKDISESDFAKNINENHNVSSTPMKREPIRPTPSKSPERPVEVEKKAYRKLPDLPPVRRWTPGGGRSPTKPVSTTVTKPISSVLNTPAASKTNSVSSTPFATPIGKLTTEKKSTVPSKTDTKVKRTSSNSSMSDSNRSRSGSLTRRKGVHVDKEKPKVKVALDRSRLSSQTKPTVKSTGPEKSFPAEKGRKKIPLDSSLTKGDTLQRPMHDRKSIDEDNDDIPFADDESDNCDVFSTPMTSVKQKPTPKPRDEDMGKQVRKRLLPIPPSARTNNVVNGNSQRTRVNTKAPTAVAFVNKTFGSESPKVVLRNSSTEERDCRRSTSYDTQSTSDIVSDSDDRNASAKVDVNSKSGKYTKKKLKSTDVTRIGKTPKSDAKVKMRKADDRSDSDSQNKKEKRRSFLDLLKPKTPEKSKSVSEIESGTPKNSASAVKSKSKKSKSENKFDKKKEKSKRGKDCVDSSLSENMKGLQIGSSSMFSTSHKARQPILSATMHAPTANIDEFSDSDESIMSTSTVHSRRRDNHMSMSMDLDGDARRARKIQKTIIKQQKLNEQKRLRMAQELQRQLEEVEVKQKELEERGIQVEKDLRDTGKDDADLMQEWFNLVHEKNTIVRFESSLMIQARELELEDRQARLNNLLRDRMSSEGGAKEDEQIKEEKKILDELLQVVEQRDSLVAMLEEDRLRESAEDKDLEQIMLAKGFALSPMSYVKTMKADSSSPIT